MDSTTLIICGRVNRCPDRQGCKHAKPHYESHIGQHCMRESCSEVDNSYCKPLDQVDDKWKERMWKY